MIRDRTASTEERVVADYLIAADGANGTMRERLGVDRVGPGVLQHWMNIIFDTDLSPFLQEKRFTSCFVTDLNATFTPRESGRWLLALQYDPDRGEGPRAFDAERCRELVRAGAGRDEVRTELVDARAWQVAAYLAEVFAKGRSYFVGDAAHVMPPTGGFGGNTGIHDVHNLAWKLALVTKGIASPALLASYDAERRPVARDTLDQALARLRAWFRDPRHVLPEPVETVADYDVVFGQRYSSGAMVAESGGDSERPFESAQSLSGRPGTRAPHMVVEHEGKRVPVHDLFGNGFVLLAGADGKVWPAAAERVARTLGIAVTCHRVGATGDLVDVNGHWPERYGVTETGAVLIRPDGFVAWRARKASTESDTEVALMDAIRRILGLS